MKLYNHAALVMDGAERPFPPLKGRRFSPCLVAHLHISTEQGATTGYPYRFT